MLSSVALSQPEASMDSMAVCQGRRLPRLMQACDTRQWRRWRLPGISRLQHAKATCTRSKVGDAAAGQVGLAGPCPVTRKSSFSRLTVPRQRTQQDAMSLCWYCVGLERVSSCNGHAERNRTPLVDTGRQTSARKPPLSGNLNEHNAGLGERKRTMKNSIIRSQLARLCERYAWKSCSTLGDWNVTNGDNSRPSSWLPDDGGYCRPTSEVRGDPFGLPALDL